MLENYLLNARGQLKVGLDKYIQYIYTYISSGEKNKEFNNAIMSMNCKDNQLVSLAENEGFKNLLKVLAPHYKIPIRTSMKHWLHEEHDAISNK